MLALKIIWSIVFILVAFTMYASAFNLVKEFRRISKEDPENFTDEEENNPKH